MSYTAPKKLQNFTEFLSYNSYRINASCVTAPFTCKVDVCRLIDLDSLTKVIPVCIPHLPRLRSYQLNLNILLLHSHKCCWLLLDLSQAILCSLIALINACALLHDFFASSSQPLSPAHPPRSECWRLLKHTKKNKNTYKKKIQVIKIIPKRHHCSEQ